mmetsp:Transcript_38062/g.55859  ORF Transcript_38062/g.55859 Transcript_38062/m.55859 type:complete len:383 (-) Transcript_38062:412-1560(-)
MVAMPKIVIAGGGIIGTSISYFLAKEHDTSVTLIDPKGIAPGASSKAGGFLARQWRDDTPLEPMHQLGFDLHEKIADELIETNIDYRRLTCSAVAIDETQTRKVQKPPSKKLEGVEWVDRAVVGSVSMADETNCAQVHPRKLCEQLWKYASEKQGSKLMEGKVKLAITDESTNAIKGVCLEDGTSLEADILVVACGPWSHQALQTWFPNIATSTFPDITGVKCHSMLVKPDTTFSQAVFFESDGALGDGDLEVYPRPDGDCYVNGFQGDEVIVDEEPGEEEVEQEYIDKLKRAMDVTSTALGGLQPHTVQACYWPETGDGLPIIGNIPNHPGAFIATGHSVWGILQGPSTGKAVAELLMNGSSACLDLSPFDPLRFQRYRFI